MDDDAEVAGRAVEELSYTEASAELDDIVRFFEQRDVDVDELVGRLVRATAIVEELDRRLRRTRLQVEQLVPRLSAVVSDEAADEPETPREGGGRAGTASRSAPGHEASVPARTNEGCGAAVDAAPSPAVANRTSERASDTSSEALF